MATQDHSAIGMGLREMKRRLPHPGSCVFRLNGFLAILLIGIALLGISSRPVLSADVFVLRSDDPSAYDEVLQGFQEILGAASSETFSLKGSSDLESTAARIIRTQQPRVTLAIGGRAANLINRQFPHIPMVFCMVFDTSPFERAQNITGISLHVSAQDQFETLKSVLPQARRIGVLFDPGRSASLISDGRKAASSLDLVLVEKPVKSSFEIANAIKELIWTIDALWMVPDRTVISKESFRYMLEASLNRKVPILAFSEGFVKGGALMALSPDYPGIGRQAGQLAKKILSGSSASGLPFSSPKSNIVLNLNTAKALNITIPPSVLLEVGKIY